MKDSTARKLRQIPPGYLLVGIDPHKKRHAVAIMTPQAMVLAKFKVSNSLDGFAHLCQRVDQEVDRQGASGAMYAIEAGSHFWRNLAYFLEGQGRPFRLVNPYTLKRRREGEDLDRRKNDFRDATMAAELLRTGKFTETRLPHGTYAELRAAYQAYRRVRGQRTQTVNLLRSLLDGLFPEFCHIFKHVTGKTAMAVLAVCPMPATIAEMSAEEFVNSVRQASPRDRLVAKKLRALHAEAQRSAGVAAGASTVTTEVRHTVQQVQMFHAQATVWEDRLAALIATLPESRFLLSIPGVGPLTVAGLLGELGPLTSYSRAKQLVKMAGTNPTEAESAGKRSRHSPMSKKGRSALRWCLWMASVALLRHNPDFADWARTLRERPAHAHPLKSGEVLGAVGNRLLRLAYALVKQQTMYRLPTPQPVAA